MLAVSESTPGPIGINMATYVGFHRGAGVPGAIIATLGEVTPSIVVILIIAADADQVPGQPAMSPTPSTACGPPPPG